MYPACSTRDRQLTMVNKSQADSDRDRASITSSTGTSTTPRTFASSYIAYNHDCHRRPGPSEISRHHSLPLRLPVTLIRPPNPGRASGNHSSHFNFRVGVKPDKSRSEVVEPESPGQSCATLHFIQSRSREFLDGGALPLALEAHKVRARHHLRHVQQRRRLLLQVLPTPP